jgi:hypothetical protein
MTERTRRTLPKIARPIRWRHAAALVAEIGQYPASLQRASAPMTAAGLANRRRLASASVVSDRTVVAMSMCMRK